MEQRFDKLLLVDVEVFTSVLFSAAFYYIRITSNYGDVILILKVAAPSPILCRNVAGKNQQIAPSIDTNPPGTLDHVNKFY